MVEGELVPSLRSGQALNAVKDSSLDSRRSERLGADPLRMTLIPDNLQGDKERRKGSCKLLPTKN
jgi:hypothetical protein